MILDYHRHDRVVHVRLHTKGTQHTAERSTARRVRALSPPLCCTVPRMAVQFTTRIRTCRASSPGVLNVFGCGIGPARTSISVRFADEFLHANHCAVDYHTLSTVQSHSQWHGAVRRGSYMYRLSIKTCWSARSIPMSVCSIVLESTDRPKMLFLSFTSYLRDMVCMHKWISANQYYTDMVACR